MNDKYKIITLFNGTKHLAVFNTRSNKWLILGSEEFVFDAQVMKVEEAMQ